jgi:hypothetical protein
MNDNLPEPISSSTNFDQQISDYHNYIKSIIPNLQKRKEFYDHLEKLTGENWRPLSTIEQDKSSGSRAALSGNKKEADFRLVMKEFKINLLAQSHLFQLNVDYSIVKDISFNKVRGREKTDHEMVVSFITGEQSIFRISQKTDDIKNPFNSIDRRSVDDYLFFSDEEKKLFKLYSGAILPSEYEYKPQMIDDPRRLIAPEFLEVHQNIMKSSLEKNIDAIFDMAFKFSKRDEKKENVPTHMLFRHSGTNLILPIDKVIKFYKGDGKASIKRTTFHLGRISIQRKGAEKTDAHPDDLQIKFNYTDIFKKEI